MPSGRSCEASRSRPGQLSSSGRKPIGRTTTTLAAGKRVPSTDNRTPSLTFPEILAPVCKRD